MSLAAARNLADRPVGGKHVPRDLVEPFRRLGAACNARLVEELGLTAYLADRFTICGPPNEFVSKIRMLTELGVNRVMIAILAESDREAKMERFADEVMPHFR